MIKGKRLSFAHLEGDICVYNLTKGDKEYLKSNGLKKVPSILQSVEFGSLGKLYQGFGIQNDMGGVEFFHPDYTKNPVTLRACGITTVLNPKVKDTQVVACSMTLWTIWLIVHYRDLQNYVCPIKVPASSCHTSRTSCIW